MNSLKNNGGKILFFLSIALIATGYFYFWTYQPEFKSDEIVNIELVKVRNGVETIQTLAPENFIALYKDLRWSRSSGRAKIFTCYRIKVTTTGGKIFSFRTNGNEFFGQHTDTLYDFSGDENRITKYWKIQPDCDLIEK